ncbi:MAG: NAD-dependent epimerase/dehydratase family protein [Chloroflexota bacterium]
MVPTPQSPISNLQPSPLALVTGATGMLGRHTTAYLRQKGVRVRAFVRPQSDVRYLQEAGVALVYGDAADLQAIRQAVQGADLIFHLAAYLTVSAPFGAEDDSPLYQVVNVDFTEHLLAAALEAGVSRFIFASSNSVYALDAPVPTPEDAPLAPESTYGRSKLAAEALVRIYGQRGLPTTIVRPSVIYGPGDRYFTPTALRLARMPILPLVNGGETLFDMVYARDVARLLWRAAFHDRAVGRVYNAGPGTPTTLRQLVAAYRRLTGSGPRIVHVSDRLVSSKLSSSKLTSSKLTPSALARRFAPLVRPLIARLAPGAEAALTPQGLALMSQDIHLDMRRAEEELDYRVKNTLEEGLRQTLRNRQS